MYLWIYLLILMLNVFDCFVIIIYFFGIIGCFVCCDDIMICFFRSISIIYGFIERFKGSGVIVYFL